MIYNIDILTGDCTKERERSQALSHRAWPCAGMRQGDQEVMEKSRLSTEREWASRFMDAGKVSYEAAAPLALFADPATSTGGEKATMEIPSHEALKGFTKNIFWKPCLIWHIDRVRIMNPIRTWAEGQRLLGIRGDVDRVCFTYLTDVRYQVEAHFEFNRNRPEFEPQWKNSRKYYSEFVRAAMAEGRRVPFFGKSECLPTYIRLCEFGAGDGYYDGKGERRLGYLYYGLTYPDEAYDSETKGMLTYNVFNAVMKDGIVTYPDPSECLRRAVREFPVKQFPEKREEAE